MLMIEPSFDADEPAEAGHSLAGGVQKEDQARGEQESIEYSGDKYPLP